MGRDGTETDAACQQQPDLRAYDGAGFYRNADTAQVRPFARLFEVDSTIGKRFALRLTAEFRNSIGL